MAKSSKCQEFFPRCLCNLCKKRDTKKGCCIAHRRTCQSVNDDPYLNHCEDFVRKAERDKND